MTKRGLIVILMALFVVAGFGSAFAVQSNGMTSGNGPTLPTAGFIGATNFFSATTNPTAGFTDGLDVHVNPDGLGDALIYNYFNARSGMGTYFDLVNTSDSYIRVRARFYEGANIGDTSCNDGSMEILDFDVCLTPWDVWSGWLVQQGAGSVLCSADTHTLIWDSSKSATFPVLATGNAAATSGCVATKNKTNGGDSHVTADQTLEGYFVFIGMGIIDGSPYSCNPTTTGAPFADTPNVLFGSSLIANLDDPTNSPFYEYTATAVADFANDVFSTDVGAGSTPDLQDSSDTLVGINYMLTKEHLYGTYLLDGTWTTEYILTFPTKRLTHSVFENCTTSIFEPNTVSITKYDMDETPDLPTGCSFSPCPQNPQDAIPYEVDLITVSKKNGTVNTIMPTSGLRLADIIRTPFDRGWIDIDMNNDTDSRWTSVGSDAQGTTTWTTHGWPVLGLQLVNNKNYSGARPIQALTNVTVGVGAP